MLRQIKKSLREFSFVFIGKFQKGPPRSRIVQYIAIAKKKEKWESDLSTLSVYLVTDCLKSKCTVDNYSLLPCCRMSVIQHSLFKSCWWRRRRRSATREQNSCSIGLSSRTFLCHNPLIILTPHLLRVFVINLFAWDAIGETVFWSSTMYHDFT